MIPGMSGGMSNSSSATATGQSGDAGGIGDKSFGFSRGGQGMLNNNGFQFGDNGIDTKWLIGGGVVIAGMFMMYLLKK